MAKIKSQKQATTAGRKRQDFRTRTNPGSNVYISGSFNNWNAEEKK